MTRALASVLDLTPPAFAEGLCDWSRGDGAFDGPTYESGGAGRIARADADFGDCLELRKIEARQRLRYMGEMPLRRGVRIELRVRIKALRGPLPAARLAASAGTGRGATTCLTGGPALPLRAHGAVVALRATIGRGARPDVDIVWDEAARYVHVGLDLLGPCGGVLRVEDLRARELADPRGAGALPGF